MAIRGEFKINGRGFAVADAAFCELQSNGTLAFLGAVANDALPVTFAASPQQLILASGGLLYLFQLTTNTFSQIPPATFDGPVAQVGICDDFFLVWIQNSKLWYVSAVLDATDWTTNGSAIISVFPDNLTSMLVDHRQVWFWSDDQSQVYYDSGNIFPFDIIQGAFIEAGCGAQSSPVRLDNTVFWQGEDERGQGVIYRSYGYVPRRVSNHAIEQALQSYTRIDDAIGFGYQDAGHQFYVLNYPTANKTWVFDTLTNMWAERGYWLESIGQYERAHAQNHMFIFGKHLVGDWKSNNIYEMKRPYQKNGQWFFADDAGNPIRRARRAPHISKEQTRQFFFELIVYLEAGIGPVPPLQGYAPPGSLILEDSNSVFWNVSVLDNSQLQAIQTVSGTPQTVVLNDSVGNAWTVGISTVGKLTLTAHAAGAFPLSYALTSATGKTQWLLLPIPAQPNGTEKLEMLPGQIFARAPKVTLRYSDDGAHTWSNNHDRSFGMGGEYKHRTRFARLGQARDRVFELSCADPVPCRIVDAYLNSRVNV